MPKNKQEIAVEDMPKEVVEKDLRQLTNMVYVLLAISSLTILGFGLLLHYANSLMSTVQVDEATGAYQVVSDPSAYKAGYIAGATIFGVSGLFSLVMGIVLLAVRKRGFFDQGLVTGAGIVAILGGMIIGSFIMATALLMRIATQRAWMKQYELEEQESIEAQKDLGPPT